jgi:putative membrane protein
MSQPQAFVDSLEAAIAALESQSSAEIVIAIVPSSGRYSDVDLLWGWLAGLATLALILWSPWPFHPDFVLLNVVFVSLLGWFASRHSSLMRRLLTTRARRSAQLQRDARLEFLRAGVDRTRERTGLLLYLSRFERGIALVPDQGLAEKLPAELLAQWQGRFGAAPNLKTLLDWLPQLLEEMREPLALHLPARADDIDELANRPRLVER